MSEAERQPGLWALVREDLRSHHGDWTRPGFRALAVYRFGVWRMKVRPKLVRAPLSLLYCLLHVYVRNHYGIELPKEAKAVNSYAERLFEREGFMLSLTEAERELRL